MTRYEAIKNMSLEEMADVLKAIDPEEITKKIQYCEKICPWTVKCHENLIGDTECFVHEYKEIMMAWLMEDVDNITDEKRKI